MVPDRSVVETVLNLGQITIGVFTKVESMVGSIDGCFQVTQLGIHGAECRMLRRFPSGAVVHNNGRVRSAAGSYATEAAQTVGQHLGGRHQRLLGPGFDGFLGERDAGEASYDRLAVLCSLYSRDEGDFVFGAPSAFARAFAAQVDVINFDTPFEDTGGFALSHDLQQLELHQPGGLVAHAQMAHEFQRGDVVLRLGQQVHCQKPERQRQFRRLEDRTGDDSRLVSARLALPVLPAFADKGAVMGFPRNADKQNQPASTTLPVPRGTVPPSRNASETQPSIDPFETEPGSLS
jgi:hypothetical protein